jgi:OPA family glycerol-3-phosphate transporter-like MFS transporter
VFLVSAGTLGIIGVVSLFTLKSRPSQLGLPEPPPPPGNVYGSDSAHQPVSLGKLLGPLCMSFTFWLVCLMNVGLTLIRETFNLWNPTYLNEVVKLDAGTAGMASLVFPLLGAVSSLFAGWLVDQLNGRYGLVVVSSLVGLVIVLVLLALLPLEGRPWVALVMIGAVAFFLLAPYTFCSGVLAVKLGGQRGGSTAAGIIDTAGYLGATLAGSGIGRIADAYGWGIAFGSLAGVGCVTMLPARHDKCRDLRRPWPTASRGTGGAAFAPTGRIARSRVAVYRVRQRPAHLHRAPQREDAERVGPRTGRRDRRSARRTSRRERRTGARG